MRILALDLAKSTGYAYREGGEIISGTKVFDAKTPGARFSQLASWLSGIAGDAEFVIYERPHFRGYGATFSLVGMASQVAEFCANQGIECADVHTNTLKKWATGRGNAGKPEMVEAARQWVPGVESDDEADAVCVLKYAEETLERD